MKWRLDKQYKRNQPNSVDSFKYNQATFSFIYKERVKLMKLQIKIE